jgi:hypothetical protein
MNAFIKAAVLGWALLLASAVPASALLCATAPICAEYWRVSDVFVGVAQATPLQPSGQRLGLVVEESLKGTTRRGELVAATSYDALEHGVRYLVFGSRDAQGRVGITCSRTAPLASETAAADLSYVRRVKGGGLVTGRVAGLVMSVRRNRHSRGRFWSPIEPVRLARVMLYNTSRYWITETTQSGRFVVPHVPPGKYAIRVQTPLAVATVSIFPTLSLHSADPVEIQGPGACALPYVGILPPGETG